MIICKENIIEIETSQLASRGSGLISRCIYINELLKAANLNDKNLKSDPTFDDNGKAVLIFSNKEGTLFDFFIKLLY
jgi:hypothetical protein